MSDSLIKNAPGNSNHESGQLRPIVRYCDFIMAALSIQVVISITLACEMQSFPFIAWAVSSTIVGFLMANVLGKVRSDINDIVSLKSVFQTKMFSNLDE